GLTADVEIGNRGGDLRRRPVDLPGEARAPHAAREIPAPDRDRGQEKKRLQGHVAPSRCGEARAGGVKERFAEAPTDRGRQPRGRGRNGARAGKAGARLRGGSSRIRRWG